MIKKSENDTTEEFKIDKRNFYQNYSNNGRITKNIHFFLLFYNHLSYETISF